jgi:hypothetical protein
LYKKYINFGVKGEKIHLNVLFMERSSSSQRQLSHHLTPDFELSVENSINKQQPRRRVMGEENENTHNSPCG